MQNINRSNSFRQDGFYYKIYPKNHCLDFIDDINSRISKINSFDFRKYDSLVETTISIGEDSYIYKQKLLNIIKLPTKVEKSDFYKLIDALEYFQDICFVHGDLNKKNIIYTDDGFKIIDYEPSLLQIKNGVEQLMVTIPYVDKSELDNLKITVVTDKIGFFYFILKIYKKFSSMDIVNLSKKLNHDKIIKCDIQNLSYMDILDLALNS